MNSVRDLYLGWAGFAHEANCPQPMWEPQVRRDEGRRGRLLTLDEEHGCKAEGCEHCNVFPRVTIRLVCWGCGAVHTVSGEDVTSNPTTTDVLGYGRDAQELAGLWLWPGSLVLPGTDDEPHDWLVTRTPNRPQLAAEVAGLICRHRTAGGHLRWQANAIADPTGPHGDDQLRWARRQSDFLSVEKAAEWIATQYQPQRVAVTV
ncbi:hypothetical protein [Streptomyces sp. NPDC102487]|uniref:hypothetical protein n=1 Tax=Streptomyces sp. NPDC102487 TaxID=3366182 RepID=UPI00381ED2DD